MNFHAKSAFTWIGTALALALLSMPALSQRADEPKVVELGKVTVTGSHIPGRVAETVARPLTVISSEDIVKLGAQEMVRVLRQEPAFMGGTYNGGSGGYFSGATNDLNLRGIGSQYTTVLVNGRPFTGNMSNIPPSAVARVEVLKDGGSSTYGSYSVAGVVNIILNTAEMDGMEVDATYGQRLGSDGAAGYDSSYGFRFGAKGERARFVTNFAFRERGATRLVDTKVGRTKNLDLTDYYSSPANIWTPSGENVILDYNRFSYGDYSNDPADYIPYDPLDYNTTIGMRERELLNDRSPQEAISNFSFGELDLTENATAYMELFYSHTKQSEKNKNWGVDFYGDSHLDFGPVPATNPYNPFGEDLRDVYYGLPEIGGVQYDSQLTTWRIVGGIRGAVGKFSYDIGLTYLRDEHDEQLYNQYSDSGLLAAINRPGADALNPFCYGCNTPEQLAGIAVSDDLGSVSETRMIDAQLTGKMIDRENYDIDFAIGAEAREDTYDYHVDPLTATGDVYYQQFSAYSDSSDAQAVYGELVYILDESAGIPAIHQFTAQVSARTDWLDQGSDTNPHLSVSWQPVSDDFTVRASYGTSYVPAPLYLITDAQYVSNYVLYYPETDEYLPTDVLEGGNPNLQPEDATTTNLGVIFAPHQLPGFQLSVDYFRIKQDGVVLVPNPQDIIDGTYPGEVDYSGVRPRIEALASNAGTRKVEGYDFALDWQSESGSAGTFGLTLHGTYLTKFQVNNGNGAQDKLGEFSNFVFVSTSYGNFGSIPRLRAIGGPTWTNPSGNFNTEFTVNYTDGYSDAAGTARDVGEFVTYDLNFSVDLQESVKGLTMNAGILNVFDEEPPYVAGYRNLFVVYDPALANSLGRAGFLGLKYQF